MIRVIFDTNTLISAIFWPGIPHNLLDAAESGEIELVTSVDMLEEFEEVLIKEKKFQLDRDSILKFTEKISRLSSLVETIIEINFPRDPKDSKVLECAVSSNADYIITSDKDLLDLEEFLGIKVMSAKSFKNVLFSKSPL